PAPPAPPAVTPPPAAVQPPPPVIQAPAAPPPVAAPAPRLRPPPPVASFRVPAVIPRGGVPYRIRYGDTLWDIAEAFYRDPLLYPHIARFNNIRNPNLIISGTLIHVPPRN
ncbi:MAG: LysM peptidoglycan-binding domain-containing protein, partial [Treponema sp.]|nr:LysM peptidoglycan-binding domain-containing protein [Treponema sp.]